MWQINPETSASLAKLDQMRLTVLCWLYLIFEYRLYSENMNKAFYTFKIQTDLFVAFTKPDIIECANSPAQL